MWRHVLCASAAVIGGAAVTTSASAASIAVELTQTLGKGDRLQLVVSDVGSSAVETRGKARVGIVVDYEGGRVHSLDYAKRAYLTQPIEDVVAELRRERGAVTKMRTEVDLRRDGTNAPRIKAPTLTPLDLRTEIAGRGAQAYALRQEGVKSAVRVWL